MYLLLKMLNISLPLVSFRGVHSISLKPRMRLKKVKVDMVPPIPCCKLTIRGLKPHAKKKQQKPFPELITWMHRSSYLPRSKLNWVYSYTQSTKKNKYIIYVYTSPIGPPCNLKVLRQVYSKFPSHPRIPQRREEQETGKQYKNQADSHIKRSHGTTRQN